MVVNVIHPIAMRMYACKNAKQTVVYAMSCSSFLFAFLFPHFFCLLPYASLFFLHTTLSVLKAVHHFRILIPIN